MEPAMRILVVEDDKKVASFLEQGLREDGYSVDVAHDGTRGDSMAHLHDYDLLILDVMLPGKNGVDIVRGPSAERHPCPHPSAHRQGCGRGRGPRAGRRR
jgi:DNA-binding response OmpR family regulator